MELKLKKRATGTKGHLCRCLQVDSGFHEPKDIPAYIVYTWPKGISACAFVIANGQRTTELTTEQTNLVVPREVVARALQEVLTHGCKKIFITGGSKRGADRGDR